MLAATAGLAVDNGILVDERLETSVPGVFAAGDVANARHPFYGATPRRALGQRAQQGPAAARGMLGSPTDATTRIPYFFSDQYDVGMEYSGYAPRVGSGRLPRRPAAREFIAFWLADGACWPA